MRGRMMLCAVLGIAALTTGTVARAAGMAGAPLEAVGPGRAIPVACDSDGVTTTFETTYNTRGVAGSKVASVTIAHLSNNCDGHELEVRVLGLEGTLLEPVRQTVPVDGRATAVTVRLSQHTLAAAVTAVDVVVSG